MSSGINTFKHIRFTLLIALSININSSKEVLFQGFFAILQQGLPKLCFPFLSRTTKHAFPIFSGLQFFLSCGLLNLAASALTRLTLKLLTIKVFFHEVDKRKADEKNTEAEA